AEEAALPAAERMECGRHGGRDVDADHARAHAPREVAGGAPVGREARGAVAELVSIDELDGGLQVRHADDAEDGTEDLLAVDSHRRRDVVEKRRAEEKPLLAA